MFYKKQRHMVFCVLQICVVNLGDGSADKYSDEKTGEGLVENVR